MRIAIFAGAFAVLSAPVSADIQPNDGTWSGTWIYVGSSGCPKDVIDQMISAPAADRSYTHALTFPDPFDPAALSAAGVGDFTWTRLDEDLWHASHIDAQATPMGPISTEMEIVLRVTSADTMAQDVDAKVVLPPAIASMMGMGGACNWQARVDHKRGAP
ncbi:hypothetical protein ACP2AV_07410 [Aliiroseovarius sp. PTFE2010]|uniref:hypothetical protein n=1 Tax=Aliiroseovarius sp. PTFE2010 TaxID=3417190 RepID=UPI003CEBFCBF